MESLRCKIHGLLTQIQLGSRILGHVDWQVWTDVRVFINCGFWPIDLIKVELPIWLESEVVFIYYRWILLVCLIVDRDHREICQCLWLNAYQWWIQLLYIIGFELCASDIQTSLDLWEEIFNQVIYISHSIVLSRWHQVSQLMDKHPTSLTICIF